MWSIWLQYSIEFVPILSLALFDTLLLLKQPKLRYSIALISVALAIHINIFEMDNSDYPYHKLGNRQRLRFYNEEHYQQDFLVKEIHEALKLIPAKGIVSAHGNLGPHLAFRDTILLYPNITNADYIAIFRDTKGVGTWPLNLEDYNRKLIELDSSNSYQRIYDKKSLVIFRRK
ncbi:MAG: DUF2079 domain-containing protein [Bacteroidetes bacterium]|nr:DUF2079 domain-containing protein [Bacteroidota bacterium]